MMQGLQSDKHHLTTQFCGFQFLVGNNPTESSYQNGFKIKIAKCLTAYRQSGFQCALIIIRQFFNNFVFQGYKNLISAISNSNMRFNKTSYEFFTPCRLNNLVLQLVLKDNFCLSSAVSCFILPILHSTAAHSIETFQKEKPFNPCETLPPPTGPR